MNATIDPMISLLVVTVNSEYTLVSISIMLKIIKNSCFIVFVLSK